MERSEFDAFTAEDARVKATEETDAGRRGAWWELAAAIDVRAGTTAGALPQELRDRLYETTGAASTDITVELLARSLRDPDRADGRRDSDGTDEHRGDSDSHSTLRSDQKPGAP